MNEEKGRNLTFAVLAGGNINTPAPEIKGPDVIVDRTPHGRGEVDRIVDKVVAINEKQIIHQHTAYAADSKYFYVPLVAFATADNSLSSRIGDKGYETKEQLSEAVTAFFDYAANGLLGAAKYVEEIWNNRETMKIQVLVVVQMEEGTGTRVMCKTAEVSQ